MTNKQQFDAQYLVWWTSQKEVEEIVSEGQTTPHTATLLQWPEYLHDEFNSRVGRPGRGRLWVAGGMPVQEIEWDENKPAARLSKERGGIVIRAEDAALCFSLPGFLTDLHLNIVNAIIASAFAEEETSPTERVPDGTYKTYHGDGLISYGKNGATGQYQLSVSQIKKSMTIFVGTLPDGWELRRPVAIEQENHNE